MMFLTNPWASGQTRGVQVAERLGAIHSKLISPPYEKTVVLVKAWGDGIASVMHKVQNPCVDIIDGAGLIPRVGAELPQATVIAIGVVGIPFLSARMPNKIVFIPEHHCNFERIVRPERPVKTVGYIGYREGFWLDPTIAASAFKEAGFEFKFCDAFSTREDACNFYKDIDIQVSLRGYYWGIDSPPELKNPLKLINAGSFKIPTVCFPEHNYVVECGVKNIFIPAFDLNGLIAGCLALKSSKELYSLYAENAYKLSERYYIDNIIPLYRRLDDGTIADARRFGQCDWPS